MLSVKLQHLKRGNDLRRAHALKYDEALAKIEDLVIPIEASYAQHVYHVYAIRVKERVKLMQSLADKGIGCGVHYPLPDSSPGSLPRPQLQKRSIPNCGAHGRGVRFSANVPGAD